MQQQEDVQDRPSPDEDARFLDVGCSGGGSLAWGFANFGIRGLGVDIDREKVNKTLAEGFDAEVADATQLRFADDSFRFALLFDVLEHMPDGETASRCLAEAYRVSRDFVIVRGPNFDNEDEFRSNSLKRYYADWSGHTWHHRSDELAKVIQALKPKTFMMAGHERIVDSTDPAILPASAAMNAGRYDAERHGAKPFYRAKGRMFERIVAVLAKSEAVDIYRLAFLASGARMYCEG